MTGREVLNECGRKRFVVYPLSNEETIRYSNSEGEKLKRASTPLAPKEIHRARVNI
jgi:hypothetical protein